MDEPTVENRFLIDLPPDRVTGVFADFANVWHTQNVFVMDFVAVAQPPSTDPDSDDGHHIIQVPGQVVQRVRIPPEQVFELAKVLTQQLEAWEMETGKRTPPGPIFGIPDPESPPTEDEQ